VFIDVTADWCITCKVNKFNVLHKDDVQAALQQPDVVALRGDWTLLLKPLPNF
jgi:suppressor for copper-sensitivity B